VALVVYADGERRYILAPEGLDQDNKVMASDMAPVTPGNALPLGKIPAGTEIHNLEITPGKGGQLVKTAGSYAVVQGSEEEYILVRLPSGEIRRFLPNAWASIGQVGNAEFRMRTLRKAGTMRRLGRRPTVRGVAQNPHSHAHGGGEGRSGIGLKYPKTYVGRPAVGRTRNKKKFSNRLIVKRRKAGKHQAII
jgi:large subunit ribosomal protein L2